MTSIEDLNKTQIILLTLLVSFVSSIATGIITTSLLAEAPVSVTQTINRVVERTIERAVPVGAAPAKGPEISKENEVLLAALSRAVDVMVEIRELESSTTTPGFLGVIISRDGLIVSAKGNVAKDKSYVATLVDQTTVPIDLVSFENSEGTAVFKIRAEEVIVEKTEQFL